jgi:hypothetical protein
MKNVQELTSEMKTLEVVLTEKHEKATTDLVCMYCWQPTETSHCNSCDATTDLQNDPFLNMIEEVEHIAVQMG